MDPSVSSTNFVLRAYRGPEDHVDTQNPNEALTLYESLGFRITGETFEYELRTLPPSMAPDADARATQ